MQYQGHVRDGVVVLDEPCELPEGATVSVEVAAHEVKSLIHPDVERFSGILPADVDAMESYCQGIMDKHQ